jgi:hypothetical protein
MRSAQLACLLLLQLRTLKQGFIEQSCPIPAQPLPPDFGCIMLPSMQPLPRRKLFCTLMAFCLFAVMSFIYHDAFYIGRLADMAVANVVLAPCTSNTTAPHIPAHGLMHADIPAV